MTTVLLTKRQVADKTGYNAEYTMQLVRKGQFPAPIKLGSGKNAATRFIESEIETWVRERIAERDAKPDNATA